MDNANENQKYFDSGNFADYCGVYLCACGISGNVAMTGEPAAAKKHRLVIVLLMLALAMFGFGFVLIPVYDVVCEIVGINGKVVKSADADIAYSIDNSREITVEFVTTLNNADSMAFSADTARLRVRPGEYRTVDFQGTNKTDREMVVRTMPSISPGMAARYLKQTECFCFTEQTLRPGESRKFSLRFAISPELPERYTIMTLALSIFDITEKTVTQKSK